MVLIEPGRDYYAELELTPFATPNDVKKQFKKLALKYHPDRNPGHEVEFNAKFQAIAAANEVLTDPALRAKFDAQRLRMSPPKMPAQPAGRPAAPPRSRTTNMPPPQPPRPSPAATSARARYERASRPTSAWANTTHPEDARGGGVGGGKTHDFRAWDQMRHSQGGPRASKASPTGANAHKTAPHESKATSPTGTTKASTKGRARNAWEDLRDAGMPKLFKTTSAREPNLRHSHVPSSSKLDDLSGPKPAAHPSMFKGERPSSTADMPPPPPRHPTAKRPDPLHHVYSTSSRPSAPYATVGGDKTHLGGASRGSGLHRSATTATPRDVPLRPSARHAETASKTDSIRRARASSAGPSRGHRASRSSTTTTTTTTSSEDISTDDEQQTSGAFQPGPPKARERRVPRSQKARMPTAASTANQQRPTHPPHVKVDEVVDEAPHPGFYAGPRRHSGIDLPSQGYFNHFSDNSNSRTSPGQAAAGKSAFQSPTMPTLKESVAGVGGGGGHHLPRHKSLDGPKLSFANENMFDSSHSKQPQDGAPIFRVPNHDGSASAKPAPSERSQSSDSIDINFSPITFTPKFGAGPRPATDSASSSSYRPAAASQPSFTDYAPFDEPKTSSMSGSDIPPPPKVGDKWPSEEWERKFGVHTFEPPPSIPNSRASSRKRNGPARSGSASNLKRAGQARAGSFRPAFAEDESVAAAPAMFAQDKQRTGSVDSAIFRAGASSRVTDTAGVDDGAMDIDSTPPGKAKSPLQNVYAEQSTWEASGTFPLSQDGRQQPYFSPPHGGAKSDESLTASSGRFHHHHHHHDAGSDGDNTNPATAASRLDFAGFRHVAPFQPGPGLSTADGPKLDETSASDQPGNTSHVHEDHEHDQGSTFSTLPNDLKTTLPFQSRASPSRPNFDHISKPLELPRVPKSPTAPAASNLTDTTWTRYVADMNAYMFNWNSFSSQMLLLFQRRQEEKREIGPSWIGAVGGDCDAYLQALDEDAKARAYWDVASERHRDAMRKLKEVRGRMLKIKSVA